jgi:prepilin-type processing-associated H-X9-DG protein
LESASAIDAFRIVYPSERTLRLLRRLIRLSGIERRHLAALALQSGADGERRLYEQADRQPNGPGMGARNSRFDEFAGPLISEAIERIGSKELSAVHTLVTVSCTHASSPGLEQAIYECTPIPRFGQRWNLGFMGCSAGLAGIRLALAAGVSRGEALIAACELSSLHFQYSEALDQMTANMLFADGAAAALLSAKPSRVEVIDSACASLPDAADQMIWFADDHGLRLELSQELPDTLGAHLRPALGAFLDRNSLSVADIAHWAVHPGGPQILDSVESSLGLPQDALRHSRHVLREFGNMSSTTVFFILDRVLAEAEGGRCVALAFGPGLTIEMTLFEISAKAQAVG